MQKRSGLKDKNQNKKASCELDSGLLDAYIGKRLKLRRLMLKMSQDELASMIGVTFQQIQKYESGVNRISASRLFVLSKVLQIDISFFFDGLEKDVPDVNNLESSENSVQESSVDFDPMTDTETLALINAYWKLPDVDKRQKILDFIISMV